MKEIRLETERLLLMPFTGADAHRLLSGIRQRDWSAGYPTDGDLEIVRMVAKNPANFSPTNRFGPYKLIERASGLLIGGVGFMGPPGPDGAVELGHGIAPEWRNRGVATEAVRGLLELAWSQPSVARVFATTDPSNAASARVLEKAAMSFVRMEGARHRGAEGASVVRSDLQVGA